MSQTGQEQAQASFDHRKIRPRKRSPSFASLPLAWAKMRDLLKRCALQACKLITKTIDFNMHSCTIDCTSRHFLSRP
jgi:hypothetical protein